MGQTIDYMRDDQNLPDRFSRSSSIDPSFKLLGAVDLDQILRTKRSVQDRGRHARDPHALPATMDQEEAAQEFEQYDLLSAAVVDENERLVGVLTIDDMVDVIQQEAEEDLLRMGGVGDEELSDTVLDISRSRVPWLVVNLVTAVISASVISQFGATIEQMVALAALMPIVASLGGNAGTQTMTVTVRALATRDIGIYNAGRVIRREMLVGLLNGMIIPLILGLCGGNLVPHCASGRRHLSRADHLYAGRFHGWDHDPAMLLDRFGRRPAISSSIFTTDDHRLHRLFRVPQPRHLVAAPGLKPGDSETIVQLTFT